MVWASFFGIIVHKAISFSGVGSRIDILVALGTTNLSKLLRYGHYLPAGPEESISSFRKANIAE